MIDRSEAFKEEFKALMDKYDVTMDFIECRARVEFYTDSGRGKSVTLRSNWNGDHYEEVKNCIE